MAESKITKTLNEGMQIPCPKCLEPMSMAAERYPNCKFDFSADEVKANVASKKALPNGCLIVIGVIIAIVVVFVIAAVVTRPDQKTVLKSTAAKTPPAEKPTTSSAREMNAGERYMWKKAAKQVVGKLLRDPDAAVYSDMKVYPGTTDKSTIICGYVNSPNAFGGMTGRQKFIAGGTVMLQEQFTKQQMNIAWNRFCR